MVGQGRWLDVFVSLCRRISLFYLQLSFLAKGPFVLQSQTVFDEKGLRLGVLPSVSGRTRSPLDSHILFFVHNVLFLQQ